MLRTARENPTFSNLFQTEASSPKDHLLPLMSTNTSQQIWVSSLPLYLSLLFPSLLYLPLPLFLPVGRGAAADSISFFSLLLFFSYQNGTMAACFYFFLLCLCNCGNMYNWCFLRVCACVFRLWCVISKWPSFRLSPLTKGCFSIASCLSNSSFIFILHVPFTIIHSCLNENWNPHSLNRELNQIIQYSKNFWKLNWK